MQIEPSTHVRFTIGTAATALLGLIAAAYGAANWVTDAAAAKTMAQEAIVASKANAVAISSLATTTTLQAQTQAQQQQQINELIQLQRKVSDAVIRIEAKLEDAP